MIALGDPVGTGLVDSLAQPGGNITGLSLMVPEAAAKRLALLKEAVPGIARVLVLSYSRPKWAVAGEGVEGRGRSLGVTLQIAETFGLGMTCPLRSRLRPGAC